MSLLFGFSVCIKGARRHIFKIAVMCKTRTAITKTTISFFTFSSLPWYVKFTYYTDEPWVTVVWDKENLTNRAYIQTKFRNFQFHYRLYLGVCAARDLCGYIKFHTILTNKYATWCFNWKCLDLWFIISVIVKEPKTASYRLKYIWTDCSKQIEIYFIQHRYNGKRNHDEHHLYLL